MTAIIEILGAPAIGKTTLARHLAQAQVTSLFPEVRLSSLLPQAVDAQTFLERQLLFLKAFSASWQEYKQKNELMPYTVNDVGLLDMLVFTVIYPIVHRLDWDIFAIFVEAVRYELQRDLSPPAYLIWLDANEDIHRSRAYMDTQRHRKHLDENLKLFPLKRSFYHSLRKVFADNVFLTIQAEQDRHTVFRLATDWVKTRAVTPSLDFEIAIHQLMIFKSKVFET